MEAKHMLSALIVLSTLLAVTTIGQTSVEMYYVYNFAENGVALVKVIVSSNQPLSSLIIDLEKGFDETTIAIYDEKGNPYPFIVRNNTLLVEIGNVTKIIIEYIAMPSTVLDIGTYRVVLHPKGPSTIYLPVDAAIISFTDTPQILVQNDRITLVYDKPGNYTIEYIIISELFTPPSPTPTPTPTVTTPTNLTNITTSTVTETTTTTPPTTTQPPQQAIQNTTTSTTPTSPASPTPILTSSPSPSPTPPSTSTPTVSQPPTSPQPTTPTEKTTTNTTPYTQPKVDRTTTIALILLAIITASLIYILYRKKPPTSESEPLEIVGIESQLDERDRAILDLLRETEYVGVSEVARKLNISKSTAWRKLQRLVEMGLIERRVLRDGNPVYSLPKNKKKRD